MDPLGNTPRGDLLGAGYACFPMAQIGLELRRGAIGLAALIALLSTPVGPHPGEGLFQMLQPAEKLPPMFQKSSFQRVSERKRSQHPHIISGNRAATEYLSLSGSVGL